MEESKKPVATEVQARKQLEKTYQDKELSYDVTISINVEDCQCQEKMEKIMSSFLLKSRRFYLDFGNHVSNMLSKVEVHSENGQS